MIAVFVALLAIASAAIPSRGAVIQQTVADVDDNGDACLTWEAESFATETVRIATNNALVITNDSLAVGSSALVTTNGAGIGDGATANIVTYDFRFVTAGTYSLYWRGRINSGVAGYHDSYYAPSGGFGDTAPARRVNGGSGDDIAAQSEYTYSTEYQWFRQGGTVNSLIDFVVTDSDVTGSNTLSISIGAREDGLMIDRWILSANSDLFSSPVGNNPIDLDNFPIPQVEPPSVALAGDSTVTDSIGWGGDLISFLRDGVTVKNKAISGRSTKSFMDEGSWQGTVDLHRDYVFIQFGHNDQKVYDDARGTYPTESRPANIAARTNDMFRDNLRKMIADVQAYGGTPVLVTAVARHPPVDFVILNETVVADWEDSRSNNYSLLDYANAAIAVGTEENVAVINLNALSLALYTQMVDNGEDITTLGPDGDNTHFSNAGGLAIAELVADAIPTALPGSLLVDPVVPTISQSVSTDYGNGADAMTREDLPTDTFGSWSYAWARWYSGSRNDHIVLRFDLSRITSSALVSASLELTKYRDLEEGDMDIYGVVDGVFGDALGDWSEGTLSYSNAPWLSQDSSIDNTDLIPESVTKLFTAFPTAGNSGNVKSAESDALLEFIKDDSNNLVTIICTREDTSSGTTEQFATKEATVQAP